MAHTASTGRKDGFLFGKGFAGQGLYGHGTSAAREKKDFWTIVHESMLRLTGCAASFAAKGDHVSVLKCQNMLRDFDVALKDVHSEAAVQRAVPGNLENSPAMTRLVTVMESFVDTFAMQAEGLRMRGPKNDAVENADAKYFHGDIRITGHVLRTMQQAGGFSAALADTLIADTRHFAEGLRPSVASGELRKSSEASLAGYVAHRGSGNVHAAAVGMAAADKVPGLNQALRQAAGLNPGLAGMVQAVVGAVRALAGKVSTDMTPATSVAPSWKNRKAAPAFAM
ncbi:MAG: hypothetical protein M3O22_04460 [Pseudomonadota bacterium]|nr:hypothetical protein [Pseudomonadota bacterium]